MTIPTYAGMGAALSGLEAMQAGLDTTSQNIANASNPDYAQETVNLVDSPSLTFYTGGNGNPPVEVGTGVTVQSITRNDDQFIDGQYWTANGNSSYYSTLSSQLTDAQENLNTSASSGLQAAINSFYSSWQSLSQDTGSTSQSTASSVISSAQTLVQQLNQASQQLSTLQQQAGSEVTSLSAELQQYAGDVAQLNTQIAGLSAAGQSSNSLQDQRAAIIGKLSALANIQVQQQSNGSDTIYLMNNSTTPATPVGSPLVQAGTPPSLTSTVNPPAASDLSSIGGSLGAMAQLADSTPGDPNAPLEQMKQELDTVASQVAGDVNTASGTQFFVASDGNPLTPITAANITVASSVTNASVAALANTTAGAVYNTESDATNQLATFVSQIGNAVGEVNDSAATASSLLTNVSNERQSVSGVSLDQEMTNLITYQQGYQASARVMNALQSVIQSLITSVGG